MQSVRSWEWCAGLYASSAGRRQISVSYSETWPGLGGTETGMGGQGNKYSVIEWGWWSSPGVPALERWRQV